MCIIHTYIHTYSYSTNTKLLQKWASWLRLVKYQPLESRPGRTLPGEFRRGGAGSRNSGLQAEYLNGAEWDHLGCVTAVSRPSHCFPLYFPPWIPLSYENRYSHYTPRSGIKNSRVAFHLINSTISQQSVGWQEAALPSVRPSPPASVKRWSYQPDWTLQCHQYRSCPSKTPMKPIFFFKFGFVYLPLIWGTENGLGCKYLFSNWGFKTEFLCFISYYCCCCCYYYYFNDFFKIGSCFIVQ